MSNPVGIKYLDVFVNTNTSVGSLAQVAHVKIFHAEINLKPTKNQYHPRSLPTYPCCIFITIVVSRYVR